MRTAINFFAALLLVFGIAPCGAYAQALEKPKITIAVGGKNLFYYLPLTIAEKRGIGTRFTLASCPAQSAKSQSRVSGRSIPGELTSSR